MVTVWITGLILACTPAAAPTAQAPAAAPTADKPAAAPKAQAPAAAPAADKPAAAPAAGKPAGDGLAQLVEAAQKEGSVSVFGPPGESSRKAFAEEFQKAYPSIQISYEGGMGPSHFPKIQEAVKAGRQVADVFINGPEPGLTMKRSGLFQELDPLLLPDNKDGSKWWQGKLDYIDNEGKYFLAFWAYPQESLFYNSDFVKETDLHSWKDLLDPKYKGKIIMYDPTIPGFTQPRINHWYNDSRLGESYIRSFFDPSRDVLINRDDRQLVEQVARGAYWIGIGGVWTTAAPIAQAIPALKALPPERLEEGTHITSGFGNVALLKDAPHQNAARLYLNWLLSREAQTAITQDTAYQSGRNDVSAEPVFEIVRRNPNSKYFVEYHENAVNMREPATLIAKEVLGR
jgi:iron(III) transport system substrate-binding protein